MPGRHALDGLIAPSRNLPGYLEQQHIPEIIPIAAVQLYSAPVLHNLMSFDGLAFPTLDQDFVACGLSAAAHLPSLCDR